MKVVLDTPDLKIFESALMRTVTTLIVGKDHLIVVDPNWLPQEVDFVYREASRLRGHRRGYLLFTHSDYDHIIGYGKFADGGWTAIASAAFVSNPDKEAQLTQIRRFDDAYYLSRDYPIVYPTIPIAIDPYAPPTPLGKRALYLLPRPGPQPRWDDHLPAGSRLTDRRRLPQQR